MQEFIDFTVRHWELCLAFAIIFIYWLTIEFLEHRRGLSLTPAELVQLMNRKGAVVVDIREVKLFEESHILGALSFPEKTLLQELNKLKKYQSKPVILVDTSGTASLRLINPLITKGFSHARYLKNGMKAWQQANLPIEKGKKLHAKS